jgi:hypothetical protein
MSPIVSDSDHFPPIVILYLYALVWRESGIHLPLSHQVSTLFLICASVSLNKSVFPHHTSHVTWPA